MTHCCPGCKCAPTVDSKYWYVAGDGSVQISEEYERPLDEQRRGFGNFFLSYRKAADARDQIALMLHALKNELP